MSIDRFTRFYHLYTKKKNIFIHSFSRVCILVFLIGISSITSKLQAQANASITINSITGNCPSATISATITNSGTLALPVGTYVSIYDANPTTTAANLIGTYTTTVSIPASGTLNVSMSASFVFNSTTIYVVVNDKGTTNRPFNLSSWTTNTTVTESDYSNNIASRAYSCTDTDGDIIVDFLDDIDDDNDGVLDAAEQNCSTISAVTDFYGPTYWRSISWTGGAYLAAYSYATPDIYIDGVLSNGIEVFRPGTTASPIAGDDFTATPIIFTLNTTSPLHADGFSIVNDYGAPGDNIVKADIKIYTGIGSNAILLGTETIDNMYDVSSTTRYPFSRGYNNITSIKILVYKTTPLGTQAANGMQMGELGLYTNPGTINCIDIDTDSDGIPNRLDLDSDGDGCPDAKEAGVKGVLTTGNIINLTTPSGTSTTTTNVAGAIATGTYGLNGFANALETANESGIYSGTYTYNYATDASINGCIDSDGDGIVDVFDLDDDNDGVLDTVENDWCKPTIGNTIDLVGLDFNKTAGNFAGYLPAVASGTIGIDATITMAPGDAPVTRIYPFSKTVANPIIAFYGVDFEKEEWYDLNDKPVQLRILDASAPTYVNGNILTISTNPQLGANTPSTSAMGRVQVLGTVTGLKVKHSWLLTAANTDNHGFAFIEPADCLGGPSPDLDGDGIPNSLDLDSDGDGCPDALEAGVNGVLTSGSVKNGLNGVVTSTINIASAIATGTYGANGLADGVETSTESGVITYTSKYALYALSKNIAACADTDGDHIADLFDIDDDNDGILDAEESPTCFMTANEWNTADKTVSVSITSALNTLSPNNKYSSLTDNDGTAAAVQFSTTTAQSQNGKEIFKVQFLSPTQLDALYIQKTSATEIFAVTASSLKLQGSNDNTAWTDLTAAITRPANATNITANGAVSLTNSNKFSVTQGAGKYKYYRIYGVLEANILAGIASELYFDVNTSNYQASYFPKTDCSNDTDGDGILNHLDLDSDDDGCADAIEAGSSATATSISVYPTGSDVNTNGLLNVYEGTTAGTISYTSKYSPYAISKNLAACRDTDGDGIPDDIDLDDDNDGILDAIESPDCFYTANEWKYGARSDITVTSPLTMVASQNYPQKLVNGLNYGTSYDVRFAATTTTGSVNVLGSGREVYKFDMKIPVKLSKVYLGYVNTNTQFSVGTVLSLRGSNDGLTWTNLSGTSGTPGITYDDLINPTAGIETNTMSPYPNTDLYSKNANIFSVTQNAAKYQYYDIYWVSGGAISVNGYANEVYFDVATDYNASAHPKVSCTNDTDGDGILNHQDLDSDGDGCPDAKESGINTAILTSGTVVNLAGATIASGTSTSTINNAVVATVGGSYTSTFGANGFANALETGSETGIYSGTYNYSNAIDKTLSTCLDSDGDGVSDNIDLDDDNDGILDIVECPAPGVAPLLSRFDIASGASMSQSITGFPEELRIDIWTLDNNFDLTVNGVNITTVSELNFAPMGAANMYSVPFSDVVRSDGSVIYPSGSIWTFPTGAQYPLIRVVIKKDGSSKIYGYDFVNGTGNYKELVLVNAAYQKVPINLTGTNKIVLGQDNTWAPSNLNAEFNTYSSAGTCDTDGDGIPNQLDLDSDNDGCSDALEAKTTINTAANFKFDNTNNFGTNGFINTLEKVADNGVYNGYYTYDFAINASVKACTDSDGDGIPDVFDLDDDNDGILDAIESPTCYYSLKELASPASVSSDLLPYNETATYALSNAIDGAIASYSAFKAGQYLVDKEIIKFVANGYISIASLTLDLDFREISKDAASTFMFQGSEDNVIWENLSPTPIASSTYAAPLVLINSSQPSKKYKYFRLYGVAGTSNYGGIAEATFNLANTTRPSAFPKLICSNDTDGDGILNHQDLDSDGDGCPDAKESGINTAILTSGTVVNLAGATIASGTSTSTINNAVVATVGGSYTSTFGANGFADALETATESGLYSGTYNYDYAISKTYNVCTDTDGDGIPDLVDIDDDNDGILDAVESPTCFYNAVEISKPIAISTDLLPYSTTVIGNAIDADLTSYSAFALNQNWVGKTLFNLTALAQIPISGINFSLVSWALSNPSNTTGNTFKLQGSNDNNVWTDLSTAVSSAATTGILNIPNTLATTSKFKYYQIVGVAGTSYYGGVKDINFAVASTYVQSQYTKPTCTGSDTDTDNIPNYLDLDSDGDGCSDALEAGTTSNTTANYKFTSTNYVADFGANGFYNALEKTAPESNLYNSIYTYAYAITNTINACTDSDGDGAPDLIDLDDDNDGVLDAVESPTCFYTLTQLAKPIAVSTDLAPYSTNVIGSSIDADLATYSAFAPSISWVNKEIFKFTAQGYVAISGITFNLVNWPLSSDVNQTFKLQGSGDNLTWTDLSAPTYSTTSSGTYSISNTLATTSKFKYYRLLGVAGNTHYGGVTDVNFNLSNTTNLSAYPMATCTTSDIDGDGIPNYKDLDSDGDGCTDAKESGVIGTLSSGTVKNGTGGAVTSTVTNANAIAGTSGSYGANGFANGVESASESGIYSGTYTYYYAIDNKINTCTDSDGDGVLDYLDIDDDNDGVLDIKEQSCTQTNMSKTGITVSSSVNWYFQNAPTGLNALVDGSLIQQVYPTDVSLNNKTIFQFNFPTPKLLNLIELANNPNFSPFIAGGTYKIQGSNDGGTTWIDIVASQVVANTLPILATTNSIKFDMPKNVYPYLSYRIYGISISGQQYWAQEAYFGELVCTDVDTDGDGISNRLDLDSDGDGCPDAVEAGTTAISSSGVLSTAKLTTSVIPAPYGNNGFANGLETSTESGAYTGTYTYDYAIDATISGCKDTDGDGVPDVLDLDDDNDGVLDVTEMSYYVPCTLNSQVSFVNWGAAVTAASGTGGAVGTVLQDGQTITVTWNDRGQQNTTTSLTGLNAASYPAGITGPSKAIQTFQNTTSNTITFSKPVKNPIIYAWSIGNPTGATVIHTFSGVNSSTSLTSFPAPITINSEATGMVVSGANSNILTNNEGDGLIKFYGTFTQITYTSSATENWAGYSLLVPLNSSGCEMRAADIDTDGDGIPNRLDLDSDGDGCADAIEASSSKTAKSITAYPTGTDTNGNGLLNVYESATAGVISYTSTYSNYALDNTLNYCTDTDNDGVPDLIDLDDDNDGVLDTAECISSLSQTFPTTGGNTNSLTDWTVGGTYGGTWNSGTGRINLNSNGLEFRRDASTTTTVSRTILNLPAKSEITFGNMYWFNTNAADNSVVATLNLKLNGVIYATIKTGTTQTAQPTITVANGATTNLSSLPSTSANTSSTKSNLIIKLPNATIASASLVLEFIASTSSGEVDDIGFASIAIKSCDADTDGDGITNQLDLDSDGDGCSDAVEASSSNTATSISAFPTGTDTNGNGLLNVYESSSAGVVSYTSTYTTNALDNTKNRCTLNNNYTITSPAALCATSSSPGVLFSSSNVVLQSGTSGSIAIKWQRSTDGGANWTDIVGGANATDAGVTYTNFNSNTSTVPYLTFSAAPLTINAYKYRIVSTNIIGYSAYSNAVTITINTIPTITTQPANSVKCTTAATSFSTVANGGTTSLTYQWQVNTNTSSPTWTSITAGNVPNHAGITYSGFTSATLNLSAAPATANNYQYRVIVTNSCGSVTSSSTTLNPTPVAPSITAGGALAICEGSSVTLSTTPVANVSYQWYKNSVLIGGATTTSIDVSQSGVYSLTAKLAGGCTIENSNSAAATTVVVNPIPTASITQGAVLTLASGASIVLTVSTNAITPTYIWYTAAIGSNTWSIVTGQTTNSLSVLAAGQYKVSVISSTGCSVLSDITTVSVLPATSVTGSTTFCAPGSVIISINKDAGQTATWEQNTIGGSSSSWTTIIADVSSTNSSTYTATSTGSYRVVLSGGTGGTANGNSENINVTVNPLPTPTITASSNSICAGESISLTGSGGPSYQWLLNGAAISSATSATYTPTLSGDYALKVVDPNTCEATSSTYTITINPLPTTPNISATTANFCYPGSVNLTSYQPSATAGITYEWHTVSSNPTISTLVGTYTQVTTAGTYYLYAKSSTGCYSLASLGLVVTNTTLVQAITTASNQIYNLNATANDLTAGLTSPSYELRWYDAISSGSLLSAPVTPLTTSAGVTNYYVEQYDPLGTGCMSSPRQLVTVTVKPLAPAITPNIGIVGQTITYCYGASASTLTATGTNLKWYTSSVGGTASTTAPTVSTVTATTTSYFVSQTINGVESDRSEIITIVNAALAGTSSITGSTTVVSGMRSSYSITPVTDAVSYTWTFPTGWVSNPVLYNNDAIVGSSGGIISVKYTDANGCVSPITNLNVDLDSDGDGIFDSADLDDDNDGILDTIENAACTPSSITCDTDGDGTPNNLDLDSDGDGITDARESNGIDVDGNGKIDGAVDANGVPASSSGGVTPADTDGDGKKNPYDTDSDGDGIPDSVEKGTDANNPVDTDGDGTPDYLDTDSDGDGIPDSVEKGTDANNPVDTDGDGIPDYRDLDSDGDGIPDSVEKGTDPLNPVDTDGDGTPDYRDLDSDGDGIPDSIEKGTNPLNPVDTDGDGTPDYRDLDSDGDGIPDSIEKGIDPLNPVDTDGDGTPDYRDLDSDGDGISDSIEKGIDPLNPVDTDGDGTPDYRDLDSDGDGIPDSIEKGTDPLNPVDTDGDGTPDYRDLDSDGDGIPDSIEKGTNPLIPVDTDGDGIPDYRDLDSDGDGISDSIEKGIDPLNPVDTDGDGTPDYRDLDSDGDGIPDSVEKGTDPLNPVDTDGDGTPDYRDLDSDGDGIPDSVEKGTNPLIPVDTDGDGTPDYRDLDSDGDGIPDSIEKGIDPLNPLDTDGDGTPDYRDLDSDGDGISDSIEKGIDPLNPVDTDGDGTPDYRDLDSDGDGISDSIEKGIDPLNPVDTDGDGTPDYRDLDSDGDGIPDSVEKGIDPLIPVDTDGDGTPDYRDLDSDGDGIPDSIEKGTNPLIPVDTDGDGTPDYRDLDSDGDGIPDSIEKGTNPLIPVDTDGDGTPDYRDLDSDGDGIPDSVEKGTDPLNPVDTDGDGTPDYRDLDSDGDGIPDSIEKGTNPLIPVDTDGDGTPDYRDLDSDGDGITDSIEKGTNPLIPVDTDGDGIPDYRDTDSDGDGVLDNVDNCRIEVGVVENDGCPKIKPNVVPDDIINPDINVTNINVPVSGNLNTNDKINSGTTYGIPIASTTNPSGATITIDAATGTYTFTGTTPGKYIFYVPVCASGQTTDCPLSSLEITVLEPVASTDDPVANNDIAAIKYNTATTVNILGNDKAGNPGGAIDTASVKVSVQPAHGTVVVNKDGTITYTPTAGYVGTDSVIYNVCDTAKPAKCSSAVVYFTVQANAVNPVTTATDDYTTVTGSMNGNTTVSGNVLNNDKNSGALTTANDLTAKIITGPTASQGTFTINTDGSYTFTPTAGYSGPVEILYEVCGGTPTSCAKATLHILVDPVPTINPDINVTNINVPVGGSLATNDKVPAGATYGSPNVAVTNPSGATITIDAATGTYTFTGTTSGKYIYYVPVCADGQTTGCPMSPLEITVIDPFSNTNLPVVNNDVAVTKIATPVTTNVLSNDKKSNINTQLDTTSLKVSTAPTHGTAIVNADGTITYTPVAGFVGTDSLIYNVCDNAKPAHCQTGVVYYTVLPSTANIANSLADDYATINGAAKNTSNVSGNVLLNDKNTSGVALTASLVTGPTAAQGTFTINADGSYTYTPTAGFTGPVSITYQACDNASPANCSIATLHILVNPYFKLLNDSATQTIEKPINGDVTSNDYAPNAVYGSPKPDPNNLTGATFTLNSNGTYIFLATKPGVYKYTYPVCAQGQISNCDSTTATIVFNATYLPQGSINLVYHTLLQEDSVHLKFNFTAGFGPFTVYVLNSLTNKVDTIKNIRDDSEIIVAPKNDDTKYTLLTIIDSNNVERNINLTKDTTLLSILKPKIVLTLKADLPTKHPDNSFSTKILMKVKNNGEIDLQNVQVNADLSKVFPQDMKYSLDSVRVASGKVKINPMYTGFGFKVKPNYITRIDHGFTIKYKAQATLSGIDLFDNGVGLNKDEESDVVFYLTVIPGKILDPLVLQFTGTGDGLLKQDDGKISMEPTISVSHDNSNVLAHPDLTKIGTPLPTYIPLYIVSQIGASLEGSKADTVSGGYNFHYTTVIKNYSNSNLDSVFAYYNLRKAFPSPDTASIIGITKVKGTVSLNPNYDGVTDTAMLKGIGALKVGDSIIVKFDVFVKTTKAKYSWPSFLITSGITSAGYIFVKDSSTNGLDPDPNKDSIPNEHLPTIVQVGFNPPVIPVLVSSVIYNVGDTTNPKDIGVLVKTVPPNAIPIWCDVNGITCYNSAPLLPTKPGVYIYCVKSLDTLTGLISSPCVMDTVTMLPVVGVVNTTLLGNIGTNPKTISHLIKSITPGSLPSWCDVNGNNCTMVPPKMPNIPGQYIWCVKAVDSLTGLKSSKCVMDTVTILDPYDVIDITKRVNSVIMNPDGTYIINFIINVENKINAKIDSVIVTDDLASTFKTPKGFEISNISVSGLLFKNNSYDGFTNIDLVTKASSIEAKKTDSVNLTIQIKSPDIYGNYNNTAVVSVNTPYGKLQVLSNDPIANSTNHTNRLATAFVVPKIDIIIPGGFSPNNDGIDDAWIIKRPYGTKITVHVFNRWGNEIYANENYLNDWRGKGVSNFMGEDVVEGTYFYTVEATDMSGSIKKFAGPLTIVR